MYDRAITPSVMPVYHPEALKEPVNRRVEPSNISFKSAAAGWLLAGLTLGRHVEKKPRIGQ